MKNEFYTIGSKKQVMSGIEFESGRTDEGYVFKDEEAFVKGTGICYVCEAAFDIDTLLVTPDNYDKLAREGSIYTAKDIECEIEDELNRIYDFFPQLDFNVCREFIKRVSACIFDQLEWCCPCTLIAEWDFDEDWDTFCQEKKIEFEQVIALWLEAWAKENGVEEYDENRFFVELYNIFGEDCYLRDMPEGCIFIIKKSPEKFVYSK